MNGIGPEVILKTFKDKRIFEFCIPFLYCSNKNLDNFKSHFNIHVKSKTLKDTSKFSNDCLNIIEPWEHLEPIEFGTCNSIIGALAVKSLNKACDDLRQNKIDVLVTAPIHKEAIQSKEFNFKGHTDYLNSKFEGSSLMFMITNELKVGLLTEHVPLSSVKELITEELITNKVEGIYRSLLNDFSITKPKIAVLGINPHSGDNGVNWK